MLAKGLITCTRASLPEHKRKYAKACPDSSALLRPGVTLLEIIQEIQPTALIGVSAQAKAFTAEVLGQDQKTDIAVLKIDPGDTDLTAVPFGDSDSLRVGDWVLAIGNPFGLDSTLTTGVVSALGRDVDGAGGRPIKGCIQTDAAINPGNSGGPLINLAGEVVGINSAIISATRQSAGLGFAIPSAIAERVVSSIVEYGRVRRGYLGVEMRDLTPEQRRSFGLRPDVGVSIGRVQENTPAKDAGLEEGDIVLRINGREVVGGLNRLRNLISLTPPGEEIEIEVLRNERPIRVRARVADITEIRAAQLDGTPVHELGVIVREMTRDTSRRMGYSQHVPGLLVLDVQPGTPAADAGIEIGDILTEVDGFKVDDADELMRGLQNSLANTIIELVRGRMRGTVEVELD